MEQSELLEFVVKVLERLRLPYFLTGSIASSYFGEPRFTNDIDVVVALPAGRVAEFCREFPTSDFYVSEDAARDAVRTSSQFNILHPESGFKVDVMIPGDNAFNQSRFSRASRHFPEDRYEAMFASMEDVILKKMEYYREGGSEKHLRDITGIVKLNPDKVDYQYIADWSTRMDLQDIWQAVLLRLKSSAGS